MKKLFFPHNKLKLQIFLLLLLSLNPLFLYHSAFGATLNLSAAWTANTEADMKEYRLYRTDGSRTLIGTTPHPGTSYGPFPLTVMDGSSGTLIFVLTAVDTSNQESVDSSPSSYTYDLSTTTVTITATDNTATEAGPTTGTFTVSRTGSTSAALTVYYAVSGTATSGSDYNALSGSVTIQAGSSTGTITVTPINDSTVESDETVVVTLSSNAAYTVGSPSSATVTITSDDSALPTVTITATDNTATEAGPTTGTFRVSRTGSTSAALTVYYAVSGTATSGSDYNALSGSVTIQAGSSTRNITVTPIDDSTAESDETVVVTLSANAAYTVGSPNSATVTITSDEVAPTNTVTTDPPGLQIEVDKVTYTAPHSFIWAAGSSHTLSANSPQNGAGAKYMFASWSDKKSKSHTIRALSSNSTYTAKFTTKYSLNTSANLSEGGKVSSSGASWVKSGAEVSVKATPHSGYQFIGWSGDYSGSTNPIRLTMNGPKNVVANFTISIPTPPRGKSRYTGTSYTFSTSNSSNNSLEYQFDWDDGSTSVWGPAKQSHIWTTVGTYQVRVMARNKNNTSFVSSWSNIHPVSMMEKPFIHITSPMKGETWLVGTEHTITWNRNYLDPTGTLYLFYLYGGKWHPIEKLSPTATSYPWTVPDIHDPLTSSPKPTGGNQPIRVWIGNWVIGENGKGRWECWDTNDPSFRILDDGWLFTISKGDTGGATIWFDEATFDGYGVSYGFDTFSIHGNYVVDEKGLLSGTFTIDNGVIDPVDGNLTGKLNGNATKMTLVLKDSNDELLVFKMTGVWLLSEPDIPGNWSATISGDATGSFALMIDPFPDGVNPISHIFEISGGYIQDGKFFFTPANKVYGVYEMTGGETGVISGTLNPNKGTFIFNMISDNGNKYKLVGKK